MTLYEPVERGNPDLIFNLGSNEGSDSQKLGEAYLQHILVRLQHSQCGVIENSRLTSAELRYLKNELENRAIKSSIDSRGQEFCSKTVRCFYPNLHRQGFIKLLCDRIPHLQQRLDVLSRLIDVHGYTKYIDSLHIRTTNLYLDILQKMIFLTRSLSGRSERYRHAQQEIRQLVNLISKELFAFNHAIGLYEKGQKLRTDNDDLFDCLIADLISQLDYSLLLSKKQIYDPVINYFKSLEYIDKNNVQEEEQYPNFIPLMYLNTLNNGQLNGIVNPPVVLILDSQTVRFWGLTIQELHSFIDKEYPVCIVTNANLSPLNSSNYGSCCDIATLFKSGQ